MAWTDPLPTAVDTHTELNQYIANFEWLKSPPKDSFAYTGSTNYTTASTTWADISADFSKDLTTSGGYVFALFSGAFTQLEIDIAIDGVRITTAGAGVGAIRQTTTAFSSTYNIPVLFTELAAGTYTFSVQWKATSGTGTLYAAYMPRFYVRAL